jgi:hypothetical protein
MVVTLIVLQDLDFAAALMGALIDDEDSAVACAIVRTLIAQGNAPTLTSILLRLIRYTCAPGCSPESDLA